MTRARVLAFVATWVSLSVVLVVVDAEPAVLTIGGIVAVVLACLFAVADADWLTGPGAWSGRRRRAARTPVADRRRDELLLHVRAAARNGSPTVQHMLVDVLDDTLRGRHGVDRRTDPAAADVLLSPVLQRLVAGPARRTGSLREVARIVDDIEAL